MPHTGRTHQLRVHAASLGCPMVGDDLYWELAAEVRRDRAEIRRARTARTAPPVGAEAGASPETTEIAEITEGAEIIAGTEGAGSTEGTEGTVGTEECPLPPIRKSGGLFLQSCGVSFTHPDESKGTVQVMVAEAPKFAALLARARSGVEFGPQPLKLGVASADT